MSAVSSSSSVGMGTSTSSTGCAGGTGGAGGAGGASSDGGSLYDVSIAPQLDAGPVQQGIVFPLSFIRPDAGRVDGGLDPDMQIIMIGTTGSTCMMPFADLQCGQWSVSIDLPPSFFAVGTVTLCDPQLRVAGFSVREQDRGGGNCNGSNGRLGGTLEILSITDELVTFRLSNTYKFGYDADGTYAASRCHR